MISVIIPMYNAESTILGAVQSVLNQTYTGDKEVIIIDDGSTDKSREKVEQFCSQQSINNVIIFSKSNGGVSSARNYGIKKAKGEYIALLDADDIWVPMKLTKQMEVLDQHPEIDFIGCNRNNEEISYPYKVENGLIDVNLGKLLLKVKPQTSTAVIKRTVIDKVGFYDEGQKYAEDANFWMRISVKHNMKMLPDSLVITDGGKRNYGIRGLSSNLWGMEKGELKNIREMYHLKHISWGQYAFFTTFSFAKYLKRVFIVSALK